MLAAAQEDISAHLVKALGRRADGVIAHGPMPTITTAVQQ